jgi:hypothetical protein
MAIYTRTLCYEEQPNVLLQIAVHTIYHTKKVYFSFLPKNLTATVMYPQ